MARVPPFLLLLLLTAAPGWAADRPLVAATLFPLFDFARSIAAGSPAEVTLLLPPGAEPHSWDPRPSDAVRLSRATLLLAVGEGMEPYLPRLVEAAGHGARVVEVGKGLASRPGDPHLWLDFSLAHRMAERVETAMAEADPARAPLYRRNGAALREELKRLDGDFRQALAPCRGKTLVVGGHAAYGYLCDRYGLVQEAAYGLSPDAEPTPRAVASLVRLVRERKVRTIFFEELASPTLARTIAAEAGAGTAVLNPGHNLPAVELGRGVTFIDLMRRNLGILKAGLGCE